MWAEDTAIKSVVMRLTKILATEMNNVAILNFFEVCTLNFVVESCDLPNLGDVELRTDDLEKKKCEESFLSGSERDETENWNGW